MAVYGLRFGVRALKLKDSGLRVRFGFAGLGFGVQRV